MKVVYGNRRTGQNTQMLSLKYRKAELLPKLDINLMASYSQSMRWVTDTIPDKYNWLGTVTGSWSHNAPSGEGGRATMAENNEQTIATRFNAVYRLHPQHRFSANYLFNGFVRDVDDPMLPQAERDFQDTRYLSKQVLGITYENSFLNDRLKGTVFAKQYYQWVMLRDPLKQNNELTYIDIDRGLGHTGYGAALSFRLLDEFMLQASVEEAIRMPEDRELLGNTSEDIDPNYDLEPEKSLNVNLGFLLGPLRRGSHELTADVNVFTREIRDMITRGEEKESSPTYGYVNLEKVTSRGFDAEVAYRYKDKLTMSYNAALFKALFVSPGYSYTGDPLRNAPFFSMNGILEYHIHGLFQKHARLTLNYNYSYVHEFYYRWKSLGGYGKWMIPAQNVHDLGIVYTFPNRRLAISMNAKNLFDATVYDNWAQQKPGRTIYAKLSYRFY